MIREIFFPRVVVFDPYDEGITFLAVADRRPIRCVVTLDALVECFGVDPLGPLAEFAAYRTDIEHAAEVMIRSNQDRDNRLTIHARHILAARGVQKDAGSDVCRASRSEGFTPIPPPLGVKETLNLRDRTRGRVAVVDAGPLENDLRPFVRSGVADAIAGCRLNGPNVTAGLFERPHRCGVSP